MDLSYIAHTAIGLSIDTTRTLSQIGGSLSPSSKI